LDTEPIPVIEEVVIEAGPRLPTAALLGSWLGLRLAAPVRVLEVDSTHIEAVTLVTGEGPIDVRRRPADSEWKARPPSEDRWQNATLSRPGAPSTGIMLPIRGLRVRRSGRRTRERRVPGAGELTG
jgi:hypothetical protein